MIDTTEEMPWKFLSDSAVQFSDQDKFGVHWAYAKVLYHIAKACETPFSIALYSNWGTGKTSICNLIEQLSKDDEEIRYVYLDVWKYSNEPLKCWILLETHRSLEAQEALLNYKLVGRSLQSHLEFEESWEDHDRLSVNYMAVRWLGFGVAILLVAFVASLFFSPTASLKGKILIAMTTFLAGGGTAAFLFEAVIKELFKSLSGLVFDRKVRHISAQPSDRTISRLLSVNEKDKTFSPRRELALYTGLVTTSRLVGSNPSVNKRVGDLSHVENHMPRTTFADVNPVCR